MKAVISILITAVLAAGAVYGQPSEPPPPEPNQEQPEVLTSGPVHEAFAQPVEIKNEPGVVALNEPPANIVETPPDEKPVGKQYVWVPGYWAWDAQRNSYIWVSGCWRAAPPERYWVPGYWARAAGGWEWVPGFWASSPNEKQIEYLPVPPAVTDMEAPGPVPNANNVWIPPCWYWYQGSYVLRQGYWLEPSENWIWVPSHYVWSPRGYVFVPGYWDYSLTQRGVLFAPVYIPRRLYTRSGFSLSLSVALDIGALELNLFTYPRYCHYYFGDYYSDVYIGLGIYPHFEWRRYHTWYDPIYVHNRWRHHATSEEWYEHERHRYELRRNDPAIRPARTYREMQRRLALMPESQRRDYRTAGTIDSLAANRQGTMKFERINSGSRAQYSAKAQSVHQFSTQRRDWESRRPDAAAIQRPNERTRTQSYENKQPKGPPTERGRYERGAATGGNRETNVRQPEHARIPSPPIVGRRNSRGVFGGRITPARPNRERRAGR
ncbi:MAG TPA: hypothetical protein VMX13_02470 [Sedimentisphaerales bacterium]|nr:hypothetical protein [Sedimentisphaerales bacterium]